MNSKHPPNATPLTTILDVRDTRHNTRHNQCCVCVAHSSMTHADSCDICTSYVGTPLNICRPVMSFLPELYTFNIGQLLNGCVQLGGPLAFISQYFTTCCGQPNNNTVCHQQSNYYINIKDKLQTGSNPGENNPEPWRSSASIDPYIHGHYLPDSTADVVNVSSYHGLPWYCQHSYISHVLDWIDTQVQTDKVNMETFDVEESLSDRYTKPM